MHVNASPSRSTIPPSSEIHGREFGIPGASDSLSDSAHEPHPLTPALFALHIGTFKTRVASTLLASSAYSMSGSFSQNAAHALA